MNDYIDMNTPDGPFRAYQESHLKSVGGALGLPINDTRPSVTPVCILAVGHDPSALELMADYFADYEMRVITLESGRGIAEVMARVRVDLLVLDIRLPGEDAIDIARRLREESGVPIIMLSDRDEEADRVMCLELGADEYLTKPFSLRVLLARSRAILRRSRTPNRVVQRLRAYRFAGWELNLRLRRLTSVEGAVVALTNNEFNLLAAFLASPQRVLSRERLLTLSRLHNDEVFDRSIDVQISRLRKKIKSDHNQELIRTERGAGYVFTAVVHIVA